MDRQEYLRWCKDRALQELESNGGAAAMASMMSDMAKDKRTELDPGSAGFLTMTAMSEMGNPDGMRRWIEGFN